MAVVSLWTTASVPTIPANPATTSIEVGLQFSTSNAGSVTGIRFYKASTNTGTHVGTLWSPAGASLATVTFTGETASGWQTGVFTTPVAISTGQNYVVSVFDPNGHYPSDQNYFTTPLVNTPLTGITGVFHNTTSAFPASTYNLSNYWVDLLLDTGSSPVSLAAVLVETNTLTATLVTSTRVAAALVDTDALGAALSTQGAAVTLAVVPVLGVIPLTVTATATAFASGGTILNYAFAWGDGGTTAPNASASATHSYVSSGIYSPICTVSSSSVGGTLAATTTETDTLAAGLSSAMLLAGGLRETDTVAAVLVSAAAAPAIAFGWQLTPTNIGLSGAGVDRTTLPTYSGGMPVAGQTITLQKITSSWDLAGWNGGSDNGPQIANVTFDRCWFSVPLDRCGQFGPNNLLVDCDIVGPSTSPNAYGPLVSGGVTTPAIFRRCFLDNFTIGLWLDGAATVDGCYLTSMTVDPNAHVDGITRRGSTLPLSIVRSYIRAKGSSVTGALFVTADFALNPSGVSVSDSLFESDGVDCLHIGNNNTGGTSSYAFSNCRGIGSTIVDRSGLGTCVSNPFTMWIYDTNNAFNSTDGGRKGASVPF